MKHESSSREMDIPTCRDLDSATVQHLMLGAEHVHLAADDVVFSRGEQANYLYMVRSGTLERTDSVPTPAVGAGDIFGVMEVLSGEARTGTVRVKSPAELLRLPVARLNELLAESPATTEKLVEVAEKHLLRREMARLLPQAFPSLAGDALEELSASFSWLRLDRGETLFVEGGPGEAVYVLASGRLEARVGRPSGESRVVGEIVPGETVGEMALLTDEPRSATVVAMRASVLQVCEREDFLRLVQRHPALSQHLTNLLAQRLKRANQTESPVERRLSIAFVPLHEGIDREDFLAPFLGAMGSAGSVLHLDEAGVERKAAPLLTSSSDQLTDLRLLPWFEEQESDHDFVIYEGVPALTAWTRRCLSQADRIVLVADADHDPAVGALESGIEEVLAGARPPLHLVLLHPADRARPRGTRAWLNSRQLRAHHHVRRGRTSDVDRVHRLLTGRATGLVLSGGGARGFAHIGVLQVVDELAITIDAIAGTSAGAAVAGQYSMGRRPAEIRDAAFRDMVQRNPFRKYTLPVYSLVGRDGLDDMCKSIAGDMDISDLWIPFYCTSCDLQSGRKVVHDRGPLWKAARASMSLPGIVPPVVDGDRLLVDGGVLDNIPEEEMGDFCGGRTIAVDVSGGAPMAVEFDYEDMPSPWRLALNRLLPWRTELQVPTLVEVLMRTATVSNTGRHDVESKVDLMLRPPVRSFGLMEFAALDEIIEVSATYCREALRTWLPSDSVDPPRAGRPDHPA